MWYINPNVIRTVSTIRPYTEESAVMVGIGADAGKVAFRSNMLDANSDRKWIMALKTGYPWDCKITFRSDTLIPNIYPIAGHPAWIGSTYCLYWVDSWIIRIKANIGLANDIPDTESWWSKNISTNPVYADTFNHQGAATTDYATSITSWPRWECSSQFGVYEHVGDASGEYTIGLPNWQGTSLDIAGHVDYTRSLVQVSGRYTYGDLRYVAYHGWIIGTYGSESGWWEGAEPALKGSRTFTFTVPEGSELTGNDISVTWDGYVAGEYNNLTLDLFGRLNARTTFIGEAAIWRV